MGLNSISDMMSLQKKQLKWKALLVSASVASLLCLVSGCAKHVTYKVRHPSVSELREDYIGLLKQSGVQVATQGETVKLVIPSDYLFAPRSANLVSGAYPVLGRVAAFLPLYQTDSIQVAGYSDDKAPHGFLKMLTERQAQKVINLLWPKHMDAGMAYATGYGSAYPIASNTSEMGRILNRRIEIGFQYFRKQKLYD